MSKDWRDTKLKPTAEDFDDWWDNYDILPDPADKIEEDTPMWWAWQGWKAALERPEVEDAFRIAAAVAFLYAEAMPDED